MLTDGKQETQAFHLDINKYTLSFNLASFSLFQGPSRRFQQIITPYGNPQKLRFSLLLWVWGWIISLLVFRPPSAVAESSFQVPLCEVRLDGPERVSVRRHPSHDTGWGLSTGDLRAFSKLQLSSPNLQRPWNFKMSVGKKQSRYPVGGDNIVHTALLMTPDVQGHEGRDDNEHTHVQFRMAVHRRLTECSGKQGGQEPLTHC